MRKRLKLTLVPSIGFGLVCAALLLADSSAGLVTCPLTIDSCDGERPEVDMNASFRPTRLPKETFAPMRLSLGGTIGTVDGSHPPALERAVIEVDRNTRLDAKGLPVCRPWVLKVALVAVPNPCKGARVGEGDMQFEVAPPESPPFRVKTHAVAFNGVKQDGATTILIRGHLPNPVSSAVVIRVKVTKIHRQGRYGTKLVATIPEIAGGNGSLTEFKFEFFRRFTYRHKRRSYLLARCPDEKLEARTELLFREGSTPVGELLLPCASKR